jgi:mRNA interferase MazF
VKSPPRGEVWLVDLGIAAKVRPCLVLSVPVMDQDRSLVCLVPHTTSLRGSRFEVATKIKFLQPGAFDAQSIVTVPTARLVRRLGAVADPQLADVEASVLAWLGVSEAPPPPASSLTVSKA